MLTGCLSDVPGRAEVIVNLDGSFSGAAHVRFDIQARIDESMSLDVTYPADESGTPTGGPFPVVVMVQGGLVSADRYRWLCTHFAARGYVCVIPGHFAELAVFEADNAIIALNGLVRQASKNNVIKGIVNADSAAAVMGHSLGGVIATWQWESHERFKALALLASYPSEKTIKRAGPVLSVTGSEDAKTHVDQAREGLEKFSEPRQFAVIDGMSHYDWTDGANEGELASGGASTRSLDDVRADAETVLDAFLDLYLKGAR